MAEDIKEEYRSSLKDLTFNQKPLINALTLVAEENVQFAADIVSVIESHIAQVPHSCLNTLVQSGCFMVCHTEGDCRRCFQAPLLIFNLSHNVSVLSVIHPNVQPHFSVLSCFSLLSSTVLVDVVLIGEVFNQLGSLQLNRYRLRYTHT